MGALRVGARGGNLTDVWAADGVAVHRSSLGMLPEISLIIGLGVVLIAIANTTARHGVPFSDLLFWIGILVVVLPTGARLVGTSSPRTERLGLVFLMGFSLYLAKVFHNPLAFRFSDEFAEWRVVTEILSSGHLFGLNPLLPAMSYYPGLPSIDVALIQLGGMTASTGGFIVVGAARLVLTIALFLTLETVTKSSRAAGVAVFIYMANPNFVFYGAEFSYESLALPLAAFTLYATVRRGASEGYDRHAWMVIAVIAALAVVVTHHLTSFALAGLLLLWSVVASIDRRNARGVYRPWDLAIVVLVASVAWTGLVAQVLVNYLGPVLLNAANDFIRLITGTGVTRQLFRFAGQAAPAWEQVLSFGAVLIILLGLPFGVLRVLRHHRRVALLSTFAAISLVYPATLALRLTPAGAETANRSSEFIFLALAVILAIAAIEVAIPRLGRIGKPVTITALTVVFLGGMIVGWAPWARLPGPYLVGADTRSVESTGISAAVWMANVLGPGHRIAVDRTNRLLMGTYGQQRPITGFADLQDTKMLILSPQLGPMERAIANVSDVDYIVIDRRLSTSLPYNGVYVERGELRILPNRLVPIAAANLAKFDRVQGIDRLFDNGSIQIYDVRNWTNEP